MKYRIMRVLLSVIFYILVRNFIIVPVILGIDDKISEQNLSFIAFSWAYSVPFTAFLIILFYVIVNYILYGKIEG
jgi:hypothetical protein